MIDLNINKNIFEYAYGFNLYTVSVQKNLYRKLIIYCHISKIV